MVRKFGIWLGLLVVLVAAQQLNSRFITPLVHWDRIAGEGYVRPEVAVELAALRPVILEAAARHNDPLRSGMHDREFAVLLATILYNEHNGWFEDLVPPVRVARPAFQWAQDRTNLAGVGANYSVWPSNLRPSVALEILQHRLPVPGQTAMVAVDVEVEGSTVDPRAFTSQRALYAAISSELLQPELAVEYLAANLARGVERAHYEGVPVTWQALAAWHNQGIVRPEAIRANDLARSYVLRAAQYRARARALVE